MLPLFFSGLLSYLVGMKGRTSRCQHCHLPSAKGFFTPKICVVPPKFKRVSLCCYTLGDTKIREKSRFTPSFRMQWKPWMVSHARETTLIFFIFKKKTPVHNAFRLFCRTCFSMGDLGVQVSVRPSFRQHLPWVSCERNSSYSFVLIILKLCMCFLHGMKICMCFGYNC